MESRGTCPFCQQPVTNFQRRNKLPGGQYAHERTAEGKCNLSAANVLRPEASGEMFLQHNGATPVMDNGTGPAKHADPKPANQAGQNPAQGPLLNPNVNTPPIEVKGVCCRCKQQILNVHARLKRPDGTYEHPTDPSGRCSVVVNQLYRDNSDVLPAPGQANFPGQLSNTGGQPAQGQRSNTGGQPAQGQLYNTGGHPAQGQLYNTGGYPAQGQLYKTGGDGMPVEVKGTCSLCRQPVTSLQRRTKQPDGSYAHERGPDGKCNVNHAQTPAAAPPHAISPPAAPPHAKTPPAVPPGSNEAGEIKGKCPLCQYPVTTAHLRVLLPDGRYAHVLGPDGKCNMVPQSGDMQPNPGPFLQVQPSGKRVCFPEGSQIAVAREISSYSQESQDNGEPASVMGVQPSDFQNFASAEAKFEAQVFQKAKKEGKCSVQ